MNTDQTNKASSKKKDFRTIIIWLFIAFLLRWQVLEPRWIPSGSMLPTLQIQDKILIEKVSPRFNRYLNNEIEREAIVVFAPPQQLIQAGYDEKSALIKRVVGIPGDQLEVHNGKLIRNKKIVDEPWILEPIKYELDPFVVPPSSIWVLGDNRNNSLDSHLWGALPKRNLIGTAVLRYWPINKIGLIRFTRPKEIETRGHLAIMSEK